MKKTTSMIETDADYDKEIEYYLDILRKEGNTLLGRYALIKLEEAYSKLKKEGFEELINKEIFSREGIKDELTVMGLELINHRLIENGEYKRVIDNLEKIRKELTLNEYIEKNTLFALGSVYLNCMNDKSGASKYFEELKQKYPNDQLTFDGEFAPSNNHNKELFRKVKEVSDETNIESTASLTINNYPNPFNLSTVISYQLPEKNYVTLKVYDILGKEVATLVNEYKEAGNYSVEFSADKYKLSSGVYFYTLKAGKNYVVKKMMLAK